MDPLLLFNTVRHLKPVQVVNRFYRSVQKPRLHLPSDATWELRQPGTPVPVASPSAEWSDGEVFDLLHSKIRLSGQDRWRPVSATRLWQYHLHYFSYFESLSVRRALALLLDWVDLNPPGVSPGWEPYPISLRLRAWIEWLAAHYTDIEQHIRAKLLHSVAQQAEWLAQTVELHLKGNHLLENAISLTWVGLRVRGPHADRWFGSGWKLLQDEVTSQILSDGMHEERSPAYHAAMTHALLRLAYLARIIGGDRGEAVAALCDSVTGRMLQALSLLSHPDGCVALLNDAGLDWAPTYQALAKYAQKDGGANASGIWGLPQSGYYGWRDEDAYLIFDAGAIGPDHQPGHGHADALSFEFSLRGERIITDTGVFTYEPGSIRQRDRGTAAHNTIQVNHGEQCELWGAFRCGRRPHVEGKADVHTDSTTIGLLSGAAQVHTASAGRYRHQRSIQVGKQSLTFTDHVVCQNESDLTLRLHLAPGVEARLQNSEGTVILLTPTRSTIKIYLKNADCDVVNSPYHPTFGAEHSRLCLEIQMGRHKTSVLEWSLSWES
jgi:uncharacterized heparinase superfamily protein